MNPRIGISDFQSEEKDFAMKKVLVGGGSGFIGSALLQKLRSNGFQPTLLSRKIRQNCVYDQLTWRDLERNGLPTGYYGIANVAGENVLDFKKRWNDEFQKELFASRVKTTKLLANCIKSASDKPKVFVGASAIGYYPPSETAEYTESFDRPLNDMFGRLCVEWEAAAQLPAELAEVRRVTIRIGLVLGRTGGVIANLFWPFFMGVGGRVASGRQWFPWIHIDDLTGIFLFALQNDHVRGVLNGTAPKPVRNEEFTKALGAALMRPTLFPAPEFALACVYGKERAKMLTSGQKVIPKRTLELGYAYKFPDIDSACREVARVTLTAEETKRRADIGA